MSSAVDFITNKLPVAYTGQGGDCTINFHISKPMHIVLQGGTCTAGNGVAPSADLGVTMEDDDLMALFKGELNGMTAFMTGKLQLEGDLMLAQKLGTFFDASKLA